MLNAFRMEWYRLTRMKSFYVTLIMSVLLAALITDLCYTDYQAMKEIWAGRLEEQPSSDRAPYEIDKEDNDIVLSVGIFSNISDDALMKSPLEINDFLLADMGSGIFLLLIAIMTGIYTAADFKSGYIKNIIGVNASRTVLVAAKMTVMLIDTFLILIAGVLSHIIFSILIFDTPMAVVNFGQLSLQLLVQFLLHYAFVLLVMLVVYLTKSGSAGWLFGLLAVTNVLSIPLSVINMLLWKKANVPSDFLIFDYVITGNMRNVSSGAGGDILWHAVAVAIVFGAVSAAVSIYSFRKRDIN